MRAAFVRTLVKLADADPRIALLTGDLGFAALEPFGEAHPDRFLNVGVAEQNMVGLATGMAEAGFIPFVYSIVTFASLRPYEFIRNGPVMHQLPVRVVGIGGGYEYGTAGPTHHGLEDVGVMRIHPGLTVVTPADHLQAAAAVEATWDLPGPIYYRLGKDDKRTVAGLDGRFRFKEVELLSEGSDVLVLAMGSISGEASDAADLLRERGVEAGFGVVSTMNPPPIGSLTQLLSGCRVVVTVEAHYISGGLGSMVAEVIAERGLGCQLVRCGVSREPDGVSGSERYLWERNGLSADQIVDRTLESLKELDPAAW